MPIVVQLDIMQARRKVKSKGVRFETLLSICAFLDCQPGDLLVYIPDKPSI